LNKNNSERGAAIYTPLILKAYDWYVLGFSNRFAWECSTSKFLLPFFKKHLGRRHLDVGVGTGFYLANSDIDRSVEITLLDLNENSLHAAAARIPDLQPRCIHHDVFEPMPFPEKIVFDSVSAFYLLHCLPGTFVEKQYAIANLTKHLSPAGVLYGATILGDEARHNRLGGKLMEIYNRKGIFGNRSDTLASLRSMLETQFHNVDIWQQGKVAMFIAQNKI
jgi:ubiquinone/menaquinone biosynthesis C-methylase UbiE